jgi:putative DNA primase/helicase
VIANIETIPPELREVQQWVNWRTEVRDGKKTKPPINPKTGNYADSTNPQTWAEFDVAVRSARNRRLPGIGYVFAGGITGVDLDHCRNCETGEIARWAQQIITELHSYSEISPSEDGIHILIRATMPANAKHVRAMPPGKIEMYDSARFFTVTGHHLSGTPLKIETRQLEFNRLYSRLFPPATNGNGNGRSNPTYSFGLTDRELIDRAMDAENGQKFSRLWNGNTSEYGGDDSRADLGLCSMLAFWTGKDAQRIDTLFRQSGLMRDKWERRDYRERTIQAAIDLTTETYSEIGTLLPLPKPKPAEPIEHAVTVECALSPNDFPLSDSGNGELFANLYGARVRFDHSQGRWLLWREHWWEEDPDKEVCRLAKESARERARATVDIPDSKARQEAYRWAAGSEQWHRVEATLKAAQATYPIAEKGDGWDANPFLLGCGNGIVDLRTGTLRAGRQEDRITIYTPVHFDPDASAPTWEKFLLDVFPDEGVRKFVHLGIGYSCTGATKEQVVFINYGTGQNGKGRFFGAIRSALGRYAWHMPFEAIQLKERSGIPTDLAALCGKRFVTASESNKGVRLNEAVLKSLTGEDPITARHLYKNWFEFQPAAKYWLFTNFRPRVADSSFGFWRRVRLIEWTQRFDGAKDDKDLEQKLRQELPGILAWIVRGCVEWQKQGLVTPETIFNATKEYELESDRYAEFLQEYCIQGQGCATFANEFYAGCKR